MWGGIECAPSSHAGKVLFTFLKEGCEFANLALLEAGHQNRKESALRVTASVLSLQSLTLPKIVRTHYGGPFTLCTLLAIDKNEL